MRNINVLVDKTGVLEAMKEELTEYPERLRKAVLDASYPYIWDEENVGRAVLRKDIVFNHHVFQHSLDLFLQTLYALNKSLFSELEADGAVYSFLSPQTQRLLQQNAEGDCPFGLCGNNRGIICNMAGTGRGTEGNCGGKGDK